MLQMQPLSGNQRPGFLTSLMNMSFVLRLTREMDLCRSSSNVAGLPSFLEMLQNPHVLLTFEKVHAQSLAPATRNGIWTSKSGPNPWCFWHFDFKMCFAPQRRALFRHLNFQKWSEPGVFRTLRNVLLATTACTFSTSQLPKVVRERCVFVHFDLEMCFAPQRRAIFHLSSATFRPSGATNHWKKHSVSRLSYLFAHLHLLSSDSFSSLIFSLLLLFSLTLPISAFFHLSILSEVWLLNFLR